MPRGNPLFGPRGDPRRVAYSSHKADAKRRGIPFLLTFDEWWTIWQQSGKWEQRGCCHGQYVMARYGDKGGYEGSNVRICHVEDNHAERASWYIPPTGKDHPSYGINVWLKMKNPDAAKAKKRLAMIPIAAKRQRDARGWFLPQED